MKKASSEGARIAIDPYFLSYIFLVKMLLQLT